MNQYRIFIYPLILVVGLLCGSCVTEKDEPVWSLQVGDKLPEFIIVLDTGEEITTESLEGKESILIFFTTTCADCQKALPQYQKWYDNFQKQHEDVNFICISREEGASSVAAYWEANGFTMPYSAQYDRKVYNLFASSGVPRIYIANPDLVITEVRLDD